MKRTNPVGEVHNRLTIIADADPQISPSGIVTRRVLCQCTCGKEKIISLSKIRSGHTKSCGCIPTNVAKKYNRGDKFGKLTILEDDNPHPITGRRIVKCICECGNTTSVVTSNLASSNTTSCGCVGEASRKKHGMSSTPIYGVWEAMLARCNNQANSGYPLYGGRGIKVCEEWHSFENFHRDMGDRPSGMSIDRIDVNKGYYKDNCRWASNSLQGYNKNLDPNNTSGKSGVSFYTKQGKWSAEIHVDGKHIRLGMFTNFEDAVRVREAAELKYYGFNKQ